MSRTTHTNEQAIDAALAAWFGVTKVMPERQILRERMEAAITAFNAVAPALSEPVASNATAFLCRIWGEDIDHTLTAIVPDWVGVRRFCVEHWTGEEDATDHDGTLTLDNLKNEFDEHEADERGGEYTQTWEIGGVSIERICDCTPATPAPAAHWLTDAERQKVARYDWLRAHARGCALNAPYCVVGQGSKDDPTIDGDLLDAAIDSALAASRTTPRPGETA